MTGVTLWKWITASSLARFDVLVNKYLSHLTDTTVTTLNSLTGNKNLCVTVNFDLIYLEILIHLIEKGCIEKWELLYDWANIFHCLEYWYMQFFFGRHWLRVWRESKASLAWSHLFLQMLVRPCIKGFAIYSVNASVFVLICRCNKILE